MTPRITLLTGAAMPVPDRETALLRAALDDIGVAHRVVTWSDEQALADPGDLVVVRTTWDYAATPDLFLTTLRRWGPAVWNPWEVIRRNVHKGYLVELAAAGVPVVPTRLLRGGDRLEGASGRIVLKPAIAAGADGIGLFHVGDPAAATHLDELWTRGDVLLQPFVAEVADGERSLIYLGGRFSHAVRKVPAAGDFRVQEEHGGRTTAYLPSADELRVAEAALAQIGQDLLYARVDLVVTPVGPLLMELELIEPALFLDHDQRAPHRFAEVIRAAVTDRT
ncbi:MAG: hypothetical protein ABJA16_06135 [Nakamurella sp.]